MPRSLKAARIGSLISLFRSPRPHGLNGHPAYWVESACESLKRAGYTAAVVGRNLARALGELGSDQAEAAFMEALAQHDDSTTHQFFSSYLNRQGRDREAYAEAELSVIRATAGSRAVALYNLAAEILNHNYIRNANNEVVPVDDERALKAAIPVIAASVEFGDLSDREDAVGMLVRSNALAEAQAIAQGQPLTGSYDSAALNWVLERIAETSVMPPISQQS